MSGVNISGSECSRKTCSMGLMSRQNSVPVASAMRSSLVSGKGPERTAPDARARGRPRAASLFAQLAPQDLAGRGLRHLVDDLDLARVLVRGHPLLAERDELLGAGRRALLQADERLHGLAAVLVRHADDRRLPDRRVAVEDVL